MAKNYIPLLASGLLREDFDLIEAELRRSEEVIQGFPQFQTPHDIDVLVQAAMLTREPIIGRTPDAHEIRIMVAPDRPYYRDSENKLLSATYTHERYHARHMLVTGMIPRPGRSLGQILVMEGLAQVFEMDAGHDVPVQAVNLNGEELLDVSRRARDVIVKNKEYNQWDWLFGTEGEADAQEQFKLWSGYSLGLAIAKSWLFERGEGAASAVDTNAETILKPWLEQGESYLTRWIENELPLLAPSLTSFAGKTVPASGKPPAP